MKRVSGYIRSIPGGDPALNIPVTVKDALTGTNIAVGGPYVGSTNPINTDNVTGYFEWTCELDPGPIRIEAVPGVGIKKVRSSLEQTSALGVWISDLPEYFKIFSNGVIPGIGNAFAATSSGLNVTFKDGQGILGGYFWGTLTNKVFAISPNGSFTERWDQIILRQHIGGTARGRQEVLVIPGIANQTLAAINTDPNKLDLPLWTVKIANGAGVVTLVDTRVYTKYVNLANSVVASMLSTSGLNSTTDVAKVFKAPIAGSTPVIESLSTKELSDFAETTPTVGQIPVWDNLTSTWVPQTLTFAKPIVENADTPVVASTGVFDFSSNFAVVESPAGEANITLAPASIFQSHLSNDSVGSAQIQPNAIGSSELANLAVDTGALQDGAVTLAKLASDSVDQTKIVDGSVGTAELADHSISTAKVSRHSVSGRVLTSHGLGSDVSWDDPPSSYTHPASVRSTNVRDEVASGPATVSSTSGQVVSGLFADITLTNGVVYDIFVFGGASVTAPGAGYIYTAAIIDSGGVLGAPVVSAFNGEGTSTGSKFHPGTLMSGVTGSGASIRCGLWFKVDTGSGSVGSGSVTIAAMPRVVS
jgi:hypothetical protein